MVNKHYEAVHRYDFLTEELLREEYEVNGLTDRKIAEKYNMPSRTVVWRKRKKFGIENKCKNKSNNNASVNRKFNISKEEAEKLLSEGKTFKEIAEVMGCSVLVSKKRFKELGLCKEQKQTSHYSHYDIELTDSQKQMIMGSLLGDGTITVSGAYSCSHSVKQEQYFNKKREILSNLHSDIVHKYAHDYEYFQTTPESLHFTTGCNEYLYSLREIYYPKGKKIFPYEYLLKHLEAEGLAYWYCDDGCYVKTHRLSKLCTYGYSLQEQELMLKLLQDKFNIDGRIDKSSVDTYFISLRVGSTKTLISLIEPHIIPCMKYKIGK